MSLTASTLLHRLVLSIELGRVQAQVDPARKFNVLRLPVTCASLIVFFNIFLIFLVSGFLIKCLNRKFKRVSVNETPEFRFWGLNICVDLHQELENKERI